MTASTSRTWWKWSYLRLVPKRHWRFLSCLPRRVILGALDCHVRSLTTPGHHAVCKHKPQGEVYKRRQEDQRSQWDHGNREKEGDVMIKAEVGVIWAMSQGMPAASKSWKKQSSILSPRASRKNTAWLTTLFYLIFLDCFIFSLFFYF